MLTHKQQNSYASKNHPTTHPTVGGDPLDFPISTHQRALHTVCAITSTLSDLQDMTFVWVAASLWISQIWRKRLTTPRCTGTLGSGTGSVCNDSRRSCHCLVCGRQKSTGPFHKHSPCHILNYSQGLFSISVYLRLKSQTNLHRLKRNFNVPLTVPPGSPPSEVHECAVHAVQDSPVLWWYSRPGY